MAAARTRAVTWPGRRANRNAWARLARAVTGVSLSTMPRSAPLTVLIHAAACGPSSWTCGPGASCFSRAEISVAAGTIPAALFGRAGGTNGAGTAMMMGSLRHSQHTRMRFAAPSSSWAGGVLVAVAAGCTSTTAPLRT